jgi:hypothetical protein
MAIVETAQGVAVDVEIHESDSGDWQALYLDGVLAAQGHDVTGEVLRLIGIRITHDPAFLRGGNGGHINKTAPTLGDIEQWVGERAADLDQVRLLRQEADAKIADAARIEARYR